MIAALLIALLAVEPVDAGRPGENDAPVLIDLQGSIVTLDGGALPPGTACLTYDKAKSIRDDLADKNARVASMDASLSTNWPVVWIVAGVGVLAAGAAAVGGYVAGQQSRR